MIWQSLLLIVFGYLLGSIPTAYVAGRLIKNIDLRQYGSGTVSGSMVYEHVGRWVVIPVGLFDFAKGAIPPWLGLQLGLGELVSVTAGMAAVLGHNWPLYLSFIGGRGLSPFMGLMLVIFPWGSVWVLAFLGVGFLLGDSAPWALASLLTTPILVFLLDGPVSAIWAVVSMLLITLAKRFEANRRPLPAVKEERRRVILLRLFFDRDIKDHKAWINRRPSR
jgi:glycerol-3-phosphate acyltransferase PlsY